MSTRILLTGATGFVGKHILSELLKVNADITLVVRDELKLGTTLPVNRIILTDDAFAQSKSWWVEALQGIDLVIHAAWFAKHGLYLESPIQLDCLKGTITLAQACVDASVRRFVGIGTCFEYDTAAGYLSVNTPLRPETSYASAKAATYLALNHFFSKTGVEFLWCRLFYLYGEGEDPRRLVPYIHQQLQRREFADLTDGLQIRDYMNVRDAAVSIVAAASGNFTGPLNVCSGKGITIRELAEQIAHIYERPELLRFGARSKNIHDPETIVGICHQTSFRE